MKVAMRGATGNTGARVMIVAGVTALALAGGATGALAASKSKTAEAAAAPKGPLLVVVSIGSQRMRVYDRTSKLIESSVSSGQSGHDTPQGVFSIIERNREHFSNLYNDAPMPNMQRITWSGVAMHAGNLPGYPASHGCIRLPYNVSDRMFGLTRLGTRVVVSSHDVAPYAIEHAKLFKAKPEEVAKVAEAQAATVSDAGFAKPMMLGAALIAPAQATAGLPNVSDPFADRPAGTTRQAWVTELLSRAQQADAAAKAATLKSVAAKKDAAKAAREAQAVERARVAAAAKLEAVTAQIARTTNQAALPNLEKARDAAAAKLASLTADADRLRAADEDKRKVADELARDADAAAKLRVSTGDLAREAGRRLKPVTVFVSRKTNRLYVRQGFEPVFDVPVAIANPNATIGTHVFTAVDQKVNSDDLVWTAVTSVGASPAPVSDEHLSKSAKRRAQQAAAAQPKLTAAAALDRIEIAEDVRQRISTMMIPGSSLIVSDQGVSPETGKGTDIIVVTRNGG